MNSVADFLETLVGLIWGNWLVAVLIATGIFLTVRLRFPQITGFTHALKILSGKYDKKTDPGEISHFQALSAALSATLGLGNIAGVAIAITAGGPGALVWMWVTGFFGMATKAASCTLAVKYRTVNADGSVAGGPMYTITRGMGEKFKPLAVIFSVLTVISSFGAISMFQSNQVASAFSHNLGIDPFHTGLILVAMVALVIIGGIKRIGYVAGQLVPFMTAIYLSGAVVVVALHASEIPAAFALIFTDAFSGEAAAGGVLGEVIRQGVRRGTFSNEAGLGSAPIAHAASRTGKPVREGLVALLEPFIDTIIVCTMTGLVIIFSGAYRPLGQVTVVEDGGRIQLQLREAHGLYENDRIQIKSDDDVLGSVLVLKVKDDLTAAAQIPLNEYRKPSFQVAAGQTVAYETGARLTTAAFDESLRGFGSIFITIAIFLFAFSTMISWSYYGETGMVFLTGRKGLHFFRSVFLIFILTGSVWHIAPVLNFADSAFGLMAIPNLIALWALNGKVKKEFDTYFSEMKSASEKPE